MKKSTIKEKTDALVKALAVSGWKLNRYGHFNRELSHTYKSKATGQQVTKTRDVSIRIKEIVVQLWVTSIPDAPNVKPEWYKMSSQFLRDCEVVFRPDDGGLEHIKIGTWKVTQDGMVKF